MTEETWRDRLSAAIEAKGMSKRAVSLAAGMSAGYVHSLTNEGKSPTLDHLQRVCDVLGVPMLHIIYGNDPSAQAQEVTDLWRGASPTTQQAILGLLRERKSA